MNEQITILALEQQQYYQGVAILIALAVSLVLLMLGMIICTKKDSELGQILTGFFLCIWTISMLIGLPLSIVNMMTAKSSAVIKYQEMEERK